MTAKQKRFCEEYMIDLNATQAAKRAGYSKKTARFIGNENLTKPNIENHIQKLLKEISDSTKITIEKVVGRIDEISTDSEDENTRLKANDLLLKHLGGYEKDNKREVEFKNLEIVYK